jgi:putative ABC transport system permease protein
MTLRTIAITNLLRRKGRSLFLISGLLIGIAIVVALLTLTAAMTGRSKTTLQSFGANILITPATKQVQLTYGGIDVGGVSVGAHDLSEAILARIDSLRARREIAVVAPELVGAVQVNGRRALMMGVRPADEFRLKRWWSVDAGHPPTNGSELVAASSVAAALGLNMGDYVQISGHRFTVTGLLRNTGSQDDNLLIADLAAVQQILHKPGRLSLVEVAAQSAGASVDGIVKQLSSALPETRVAAMQAAIQSSRQTVDQFRYFSYAIVGVVIAIETLVVFVTMMGSVNERTREIGVFRAIGFSGTHVIRLILIEAAIASIAAGLFGYLAGMGTSYAVVPFLGKAAHVSWAPLLALGAIALAFGVGALASLYPAIHASRLDPTEALRAL